jgi:TfoX/Sxy family transcriptional regulator of competence genes
MTAASDEMAARLRPQLKSIGVVEKKMFGGAGFMLDGNMLIGTTAKGDLLVRVDPQKMAAALTESGAYAMHMGSKAMTGFVAVRADALSDDRTIRRWIDYCLRYVKTLPAK